MYQHQNGSFTNAPTTHVPCSSTRAKRRSIKVCSLEWEPFKESNDIDIPQRYANNLIDFNKKNSLNFCASSDESVLWILLWNLSSNLAETAV